MEARGPGPTVLDGNTVTGGRLGFGDFEAVNGLPCATCGFGSNSTELVALTAGSDFTCPINALCSEIRGDRSTTLAILGNHATPAVPEPDTLVPMGSDYFV